MRHHLVVIRAVFLAAVYIPYQLFSWSGPVQVSGSGINFNQYAAISTGGNAELVWTNGSYPNLSIQSSTFDGVSWSVPTTVSSVGVNDGAKVAMDAAGNALAVWTELVLGNYVVRAASKPVGGSWTAPATISAFSSNYYPAVVMNDAGDAIASWINTASNTVDIACCVFSDAWTLPTTVSNLPGNKDNLTVAIDSAGNGFAIWLESTGGDIYAANSVGLVWNAPVALSTNGNNGNPALSIGAVGTVLAAWNNLEVAEVRSSWYAGGSWDYIPVVISPDNCDKPAVAALGAIGFCSWLDKGTGAIQAINYTAGAWAYPPSSVSSSASNSSPSMSVDNTATAVIAWANYNDGTIDTVLFPNGGSPSAVQAISSQGANYSPQAASAGAKTIVAWQSSVGSDWEIFANIN